MTSATLAIESDFMPFAESVGFDRVQRFTETLQVESPFRATEQSRLFTALDLPGPDDPHFPELVTNILAAIARSIATKVLVLSTSYRLIDLLEPRLREALAGAPADLFEKGQPVRAEILAQRPSSSRDALISRFRAARSAVLLATGSFWEGMDFPGEQLEVLVVPRLPFAVPTDPVVEGRFEHARRLGRDPFESVSLVDAVLRLKQGVGRLLRTTEDRGVVILLDHRLQTQAYGVKFLNSMPRLIQILPDHADIVTGTVEFLNEGRKARRGNS
jgi:ATP-dependent DNA helicase DinG